MTYGLQTIDPWLIAANGGLFLGAVLVALVVHALLYRFLGRFNSGLENALVERTRRPAQPFLVLMTLLMVLPASDLSPGAAEVVRRVLGLSIVATFGWIAASFVLVIEDYLALRYPIDSVGNLEARAMRTRVRVLRNVAVGVIALLTAAAILMSFPSIRQLGYSLLASAGIIALIAGVAARPVFGNLIAGLQIAFTQPIRIDDVVIIEGEWGRIDEITSSYVVVKIWDKRTLIVPLTYFVEQPVENWTRSTSDLLATVNFYVDYGVPFERVREHLRAILDGSDLWDGKVWNLQVTDTSERTVTLRAMMSVRNGPEGWDLRCHVREKMIEFLQREHPESLPRYRSEVYERAGIRVLDDA